MTPFLIANPLMLGPNFSTMGKDRQHNADNLRLVELYTAQQLMRSPFRLGVTRILKSKKSNLVLLCNSL